MLPYRELPSTKSSAPSVTKAVGLRIPASELSGPCVTVTVTAGAVGWVVSMRWNISLHPLVQTNRLSSNRTLDLKKNLGAKLVPEHNQSIG